MTATSHSRWAIWAGFRGQITQPRTEWLVATTPSGLEWLMEANQPEAGRQRNLLAAR